MATSTTNLDPNQVAAEEIKATDRKIKIGIIGTGWIAEEHAVAYKKIPYVEVVALADIVPGKAAKFAEKYGFDNARIYLSDEEMLANEKDLDGVSVCTYNCQHAPCTIHALKAGVNVMLEKPFTVTTEEAIECMRAEKESGKLLTIGFQPRYCPNREYLKNFVQGGGLGKVYYVQTGGGRRRGIPTPFGTTFIEKETAGIGAMADIGCYSLDLVLDIIGYRKPLTVTGFKSDYFGKNPKYYTDSGKPAHYADLFGVDDFAGAFIRLEDEIILDFRIAWAMNIDSPGDHIILGTEGGLRIPAHGGDAILYHQIGGKSVQTILPEVKDNSGLTQFDKKCRAFVDAIIDPSKKDKLVPSSEIIYNQAIIDGVVKSNEAGREIEVVIPEI